MFFVPARSAMTKSDTGPFALVPVWVLDSDISALAIRVYAIHADFADRHGAHHHSRKTIAARALCSVDAVDRAHGELVKLKALTIERRRHDGRGDPTSNRYHVVRVIPNVAAQLRLGSRGGAATGSREITARTRPSVVSNQEVALPPPLNPGEKAHGLEQLKRIRKRTEEAS